MFAPRHWIDWRGWRVVAAAVGLSGGLLAQTPAAPAAASAFPMDYRAKVEDRGAFVPVQPVASVTRAGVTLHVAADGAAQLTVAGDEYVLESCFSYPGPERRIGWNGLPRGFSQDNYPDVAGQLGLEPEWHPEVRQVDAATLTVATTGRCYRLLRTVTLAEGRVDIEETFANRRGEPTGLVPRHRFTAAEDFRDRYAVNLETACAPFVFLAGRCSSLGVVMQDDVSRRRIRPWVPMAGNRAGFQIERIALDTGKALTFRWSIYALAPGQGYFDFINRVRADWGANVTLQGPFAFVYIDNAAGDFRVETSPIQWKLAEVRATPAAFRDYLEWKRLGIVAVMPWVDYDPGAWDHVTTRDELRPVLRRFTETMHAVVPALRVIGCIETDWVTLPLDRTRIPGADLLPRQASGLLSENLTVEQVRVIERAAPEWQDSFIRTASGKLHYECCKRGGKWIEPAVRVYPEIGNHQFEFMQDQVRFLLDEIGTDGVYFDEFSLGSLGSHRTYLGRWDGLSAEVDFRSGEIRGRYVDCSLAGIPARVKLVKDLLARGKTVVANFYATSAAEQTLPVQRFCEQGWGLATMPWGNGVEPPPQNYMFFSHLNTPIGLGIMYPAAGEDPAQHLVKGLMAYLRHGMVLYYNVLRESPRTGEGSFGYGPVNHMFPITPVRLGAGFIVGRERIVTAVALDATFGKDGEPTVRFFDMRGRETEAAGRYEVTGAGGAWRVVLKVKDWAEIAVVE